MLNDNEFIKEVWQKVDLYEKQELEAEKILKQTRLKNKKQCFVYLSICFIFIGLFILSIFMSIGMPIVLTLSLLALTWSMYYELKSENNYLGGKNNGN